VVLLSTDDERDFGEQVAECGALSYVAKSAFGPDRLVEAWALTYGAWPGQT
jgi:DNA-binding NarL/FixJ family response regulator